MMKSTFPLPLVCTILVAMLVNTLRGGTFDTYRWLYDDTSGIETGPTNWAYHFGSITTPTVNGVTVMGVNGPTASNAHFDLEGTLFVSDVDDTNFISDPGSSEVARRFVYGGNPATVTVKSLTVGSPYTVSFLSVGFDPIGPRNVTFATGSDALVVNQNQFSNSIGIRVDYFFTATADKQEFTITPEVGGASFNLCGLTLRTGFTVTSASDAGPGSLRQALQDAASLSGPDNVIFASDLGPIVLADAIAISDMDVVRMDASGHQGSITLDGGPGTNRIFTISYGQVMLLGLTLTGGNGLGGAPGGGAILNRASLTASHCSFLGNTSPTNGGAIQNQGVLKLMQCTLSGNSNTDLGGRGGAIYNHFDGYVSLTQCTLSGNFSKMVGGAMDSGEGEMNLTHCTVSGNSAGYFGGGLSKYSSGKLTLTNSIVSENLAKYGSPDIYNTSGPITTSGANIVGSLDTTGLTAGPTLLTGNAILAPLGDYGGPVQTMALRPGSPALDAAVGSSITSDQRGFPMVGTPDIGAYEAGTTGNFATTLAETLPSTGPASGVAPGGDFDGDGQSNQSETTAGTILTDPASVLRITSAVTSGGNVVITFPSVTGKTYTLWQSDTLTGVWTNTGQTAISGDGSAKSFTVPAPVNGVSKRFHRVQVGP